MLEVRESKLGIGRGVHAVRPIAAGTVFEQSPVLVIPAAQKATIDQTDLYDYYYDWSDGRLVIALGFGSLFNHSYEPNARYAKNEAAQTIDFIALVDIAAGDEVLINYNGDPRSKAPLWFEPVTG